MTVHTQAVVVGAGISGLTCGYALRKLGVETIVLEAAARPGGVIQSTKRDGYLLEYGPQSFSGTPELRELIRDLGIEEQMVMAPPRAPRYLLIDGELQPAPLTPPAFFTSSLFSAKTKWSVIRDALGSSKPPENDESLADFVRRKFSAELLEKLAGPFVSGIYAGNPEKLSLRSAFPSVYEAEREHGSVIRGMMKAAKKRKGPREKPTLLSFREGNETLIRALAESLSRSLRCGSRVTAILESGAGSSPKGTRFVVEAENEGTRERYVADRVVLGTPAGAAAMWVHGWNEELSEALEKVEYAPVAVVSLGYRRNDVGHPLDGFGYLIPRAVGLRTLGTVWNSSLFPCRAPEGQVLLTSFVGGALDRGAVGLSEQALVETVHRESARVLRLSAEPIFTNVTKYEQAIPQYNLGHGRLHELTEQTRRMNLQLAGNYTHGPAIGARVAEALRVAAEIRGNLPEG